MMISMAMCQTTEGNEMSNYKTFKHRAVFFTGYPRETLDVRVYDGGDVLVWDGVACHFTRCCALTETQKESIRRKAAKIAA